MSLDSNTLAIVCDDEQGAVSELTELDALSAHVVPLNTLDEQTLLELLKDSQRIVVI